MQATPLRSPAEGEGPRECERHAAKIVVLAEGTCGMVELPTEAADVDAIAVLNEKPAMGACGVDEGNEIACGSLPKLQQAHLVRDENSHDENARANAPEAYIERTV